MSRYRDLLEELEMHFVMLSDIGKIKPQPEVIERYCNDVRQDLFDSLMERYPTPTAEPHEWGQ